MLILILIALGLCLGSFANALVWRIHEQSKAKSQKSKAKKNASDLSILKGRSMCPNCRHALAWYDLLPIVSWLSLRGKCRYCGKTISWQYPLVELLTAALFLASYVYWPLSFATNYSFLLFGLWLALLAGFVALAVYDLRWMILPNRIVFPLQALAGIYALVVIVAGPGSWLSSAQSIALGVLCTAGLFYALFQVSKGKWIGGGDVKLAVVLGLVLGSPASALLMLFIASSLGTVISLPLLLTGRLKKTSRIPFGPLLITGTIIVYLFGAGLIAWYKRQILLT